MRPFTFIPLIGLVLISASSKVVAQQPEVRVMIRLGDLRTDCYPSCDHSTEWLQQVYGEVYDSSGIRLPGAGLEFDWGVDYCAGNGFQYGFVTGVGAEHIAVDGNLLKNVLDCCAVCDFQSYDLGLRVRVSDTWYTAGRVRVPGIVIPTAHALYQNFPNPFNASTVIPFDLRERSDVRLDVLDLSGRLVACLADRSFTAGQHAVDWKADGVPSGMYVFRLTVTSRRAPAVQFSRRMVVVR